MRSNEKKSSKEGSSIEHATNRKHSSFVLSYSPTLILSFSQRTRTRGASAGSTRPTTRRPFNISPGGVPPTTCPTTARVVTAAATTIPTLIRTTTTTSWEGHVDANSGCDLRRRRRRCRHFKPETSCGASSRWTWTGPSWNGRSRIDSSSCTGRRPFEGGRKRRKRTFGQGHRN